MFTEIFNILLILLFNVVNGIAAERLYYVFLTRVIKLENVTHKYSIAYKTYTGTYNFCFNRELQLSLAVPSLLQPVH